MMIIIIVIVTITVLTIAIMSLSRTVKNIFSVFCVAFPFFYTSMREWWCHDTMGRWWLLQTTRTFALDITILPRVLLRHNKWTDKTNQWTTDNLLRLRLPLLLSSTSFPMLLYTVHGIRMHMKMHQKDGKSLSFCVGWKWNRCGISSITFCHRSFVFHWTKEHIGASTCVWSVASSWGRTTW